MARRIIKQLAGTLIALLATAGVSAGRATATACVEGHGATTLNAAFGTSVEGLEGADYQRSIPLTDGRTLWTVQDAFLARPGRDDRLVHNAAVVEDGGCFTLIRGGTASDPAPWIGAGATDPFHHWFWPLGATITQDGTIAVFVAEMVERGSGYLTHTEPVATWLATVDPASFEVISLEPATDAGPQLYGWSVASDDSFTYLYGHCYRQFGFGVLGHDPCTSGVTVARVPRLDLAASLSYWNGAEWSPDPAAAVDVAPKVAPDGTPRAINPMQVIHIDGRWLAVTKEGDWWGSRVYFDRATGPTGPWTTIEVAPAPTLGPADVYNTYFANVTVSADGQLVLSISNNRWDGVNDGNYHPTFVDIDSARWFRRSSPSRFEPR